MSEGQLFLEYLKTLPKIHGRIADKVLVFDETLNIIFEHSAKMIKGDYPKIIKEQIIPASFKSFDNAEQMLMTINVNFQLSLIYSETVVTPCEIYKHFTFVCDAYQYTLEKVEYNRGDDFHKHEINKSKLFIDNNTSITPVQDAFNALLLHYNLPIHKPFINGCMLPIMPKIDYSTVEELQEKRQKKYAKYFNIK